MCTDPSAVIVVETRNDTIRDIEYVKYSIAVNGSDGALLGALQHDGELSGLARGETQKEVLRVDISELGPAFVESAPPEVTVSRHLLARTALVVREAPFPAGAGLVVLDGGSSADSRLKTGAITLSRGVPDGDDRVVCKFGVTVSNRSAAYFEKVTVRWQLSDESGDEIEQGVESTALPPRAMVTVEPYVWLKKGRLKNARARVSVSYLEEVSREESTVWLRGTGGEETFVQPERECSVLAALANAVRLSDKYEFFDILEGGHDSVRWINLAAIGGESKLREFRDQIASGGWHEVRLDPGSDGPEVDRMVLVLPAEPSSMVTLASLFAAIMRVRVALVLVSSRAMLQKVFAE